MRSLSLVMDKGGRRFLWHNYWRRIAFASVVVGGSVGLLGVTQSSAQLGDFDRLFDGEDDSSTNNASIKPEPAVEPLEVAVSRDRATFGSSETAFEVASMPVERMAASASVPLESKFASEPAAAPAAKKVSTSARPAVVAPLDATSEGSDNTRPAANGVVAASDDIRADSSGSDISSATSNGVVNEDVIDSGGSWTPPSPDQAYVIENPDGTTTIGTLWEATSGGDLGAELTTYGADGTPLLTQSVRHEYKTPQFGDSGGHQPGVHTTTVGNLQIVTVVDGNGEAFSQQIYDAETGETTYQTAEESSAVSYQTAAESSAVSYQTAEESSAVSSERVMVEENENGNDNYRQTGVEIPQSGYVIERPDGTKVIANLTSVGAEVATFAADGTPLESSTGNNDYTSPQLGDGGGHQPGVHTRIEGNLQIDTLVNSLGVAISEQIYNIGTGQGTIQTTEGIANGTPAIVTHTELPTDPATAVEPEPDVAPAVAGQCVDPDGDGFGWDGTAVCEMPSDPVAEVPQPDDDPVAEVPADESANETPGLFDIPGKCVDPEDEGHGDGWGWDGVASCKMPSNGVVGTPACLAALDDGDTAGVDANCDFPSSPAETETTETDDTAAGTADLTSAEAVNPSVVQEDLVVDTAEPTVPAQCVDAVDASCEMVGDTVAAPAATTDPVTEAGDAAMAAVPIAEAVPDAMTAMVDEVPAVDPLVPAALDSDAQTIAVPAA